jgi:hypothetical protein
VSGAIIGVNLAVRLLLELCALCALAYWGAKSGDGRIATTGLGIGASLADAVLWATGLKDESKWVAIPEAKAPMGCSCTSAACRRYGDSTHSIGRSGSGRPGRPCFTVWATTPPTYVGQIATHPDREPVAQTSKPGLASV